MRRRITWASGVLGVLLLVAIGWNARRVAPGSAAGPVSSTPSASPDPGGLAAGSSGTRPDHTAGLGPSGTTGGPEESPDLTLPKEQREYLWQIEHHGLILSRLGFSRIAQALKNDDERALVTLFAGGFVGEVPGDPREFRIDHGGIRIFRQQDSGKPAVPLDGAALAHRLLEDRRRFPRPPTVKIALMGLAPADYRDPDGIWQGTCQLRMFGEIGPGRPGEVLLYLKYRLPRPTEDLLKSDGWLRSLSITQRQVAEAPRFLMREAAAERGIDPKRFHDNWKDPGDAPQIVTGGVNLCDFNRDGCLDLLVVDLAANVLYQGRPDGTFADVTAQAGIPQIPRLINATFADLDGDGWEDLLLGSLVLRNREGKGFARVDAPTLRVRPQANLVVADYDRDGKLDVYETTVGLTKTATWIKGEGGGQVHNRLWRNLGNWQFADVTAASGSSGGNRSTFSAAWLDADENGWPDLYVINEFGSGVLLVNRGDGTFGEQSIGPDPGDFGTMGLTAGDFDNDGHVDLYVANMYSKAGNRVMGNLWPGSYPDSIVARLRSFTGGSQLHRNRGGLKFEQVGRELQVADVGWAYGPAMVDLDNDGWLDIFATCGYISRSRDDPDG